MALYGTLKDIAMFSGVAREIIDDIVTQQIGYYKIILPNSPPNMYGEALIKDYIGPVLMNCLIDRGDFNVNATDFGPDSVRDVSFRFLRSTLIEANVVPEVGDIIMYNDLYYEVDNTNENQLILGKDPDCTYSPGLENFGNNFSTILVTHLTTPERLGIERFRL